MIRRLLDLRSNREFIEGLYRAILRRDPEPQALRGRTDALDRREYSRVDLIAEVATSDEARLLGVDAGFVGKLEKLGWEELERRVRDAFWRDDATFARVLTETLLTTNGGIGSDQIDPSQVSSGDERRAVLRRLIDRSDVRERLPLATDLRDVEFLMPGELEQRLTALGGMDDDDFIREAYWLLLGREVHPAATSHRARLSVTTRRSVLVDIAASTEAQSRGIDPVVVDTAAARVDALARTPSRRPSRARRVLSEFRVGRTGPRAPQVSQQVAELQREVRRQNEFYRAAIEQLALLIDERTDDERLRRLEAEVRSLSLAMTEIAWPASRRREDT